MAPKTKAEAAAGDVDAKKGVAVGDHIFDFELENEHGELVKLHVSAPVEGPRRQASRRKWRAWRRSCPRRPLRA